MSTVIGLIGLAIFIVAVIALAMAVTWTVVRISPDPAKKTKQSDAPA